jgi:uncharacterized protein (TIGR04141 family)
VSLSRLTIFLLRDIQNHSDAVAYDKSPTEIALDAESGLSGVFYYSSRPSTTPAWVTYVRPVLASDPSFLTTSSASGLLVIDVNERFFALTFGYGRSLLNPVKIEHQFGLRVALNRIDPSQIRSLDTKTFEDMVVSKNTQVSKNTELPTFGVDISRDILRAVTGTPRDRSFAKRMSGSDALVLNLDLPPTKLPSFCEDLLTAFGEEAYKADFEWIDHLALVDDQVLVSQLTQLLVDQLAAGDTSNTHIAIPEALSWEDIDSFKIGGTGRAEYDDLDLDEYLNRLGSERSKLSTENLKSRPISVRFSRSSDFEVRWTLFQCLITEQRIDSKLYVLIEGRWFVVSESLVSDVDNFASSLPAARTSFIPATRGETEPDYNKRLRGALGDQALLLDARIRRPGGASTGIELCDVLTIDGEFIHVKRKSRSSTLSHLFSQGSVSASTFVGDEHFRREMRTVIGTIADEAQRDNWMDLVPEDERDINRSSYSVSYAVITNTSRPGTDWLPFFSKLNLMQNGRALRNIGFSLSISRIEIAAGT